MAPVLIFEAAPGPELLEVMHDERAGRPGGQYMVCLMVPCQSERVWSMTGLAIGSHLSDPGLNHN